MDFSTYYILIIILQNVVHVIIHPFIPLGSINYVFVHSFVLSVILSLICLFVVHPFLSFFLQSIHLFDIHSFIHSVHSSISQFLQSIKKTFILSFIHPSIYPLIQIKIEGQLSLSVPTFITISHFHEQHNFFTIRT